MLVKLTDKQFRALLADHPFLTKVRDGRGDLATPEARTVKTVRDHEFHLLDNQGGIWHACYTLERGVEMWLTENHSVRAMSTITGTILAEWAFA